MPTHKLSNLSPDRLATNPRANERSWLRWSLVILAAYRQHPRPYIYTPPHTQPASTCTKLRDAIRGAIAFGYADAEVPADSLREWWAETTITVTPGGKSVRIGPALRDSTSLEPTIDSSSSNGLFFQTLTFEEVCAFTLLLGNGRLAGPVRVACPPDISLLTDRLNVEIVQREDGSLLFL